MPTDNVIPFIPRRVSEPRRRRTMRAARGLAGALALALAPFSAVGDGAARLPPGHPPVGTEQLPPGHPPVGGDAQACSPELPQGHPAVPDPRLPKGHPPIRPCAPGATSTPGATQAPGATSNGVFRPDVAARDLHLIET